MTLMRDQPAVISSLVETYVAGLRDAGAIASEGVAQAFRAVPRHEFVHRVYRGRPDDIVHLDPSNPEHLRLVYSDAALTTRWRPSPSSSTLPSLMARMLEALDVRPGMRVLEIGAGTGYNAALLVELVGDGGSVTTIDVQEDVASEAQASLVKAGYGRVRVLARDGFLGAPEEAPFDRILATVGCSDLSPRWLAQLSPEGAVLVPLVHGGGYNAPLVRVRLARGRAVGKVVGEASFMAVLGELRHDAWLTEEEVVRLEVLTATTEPSEVRPLFAGLERLGGNASRFFRLQPEVQDLAFFLALHGRRMVVTWNGVGLGDEHGLAFIRSDGVALYGAGADGRYEELARLCGTWRERGRPRMQDYDLLFVPAAGGGAGEAAPPHRWVIDRKHVREMVSLPEMM